MYTIKIMNEYLHSPVWVYNSDGIDWYKLVDEDPVLTTLGNQAMEMYSSYYLFNHNGQACYFDYEKERQDSKQLLDIIEKILARLNDINDGSFVIEDYVTSHLKSLLPDMWGDADDSFMMIYDYAMQPNSKFPTKCPRCSKTSTHFYMHRHDEKHGGIWIWCSSCKSFIHMDGTIPEWWKNCEAVDIKKLYAVPDYLDNMTDKIDQWVSDLRNSL